MNCGNDIFLYFCKSLKKYKVFNNNFFNNL